MAVDLDFAKRTRQILIGAGTTGIRYSELLKKVRTPSHGSPDLRELLKAWKRRKWVDEFIRPMPSGQSARIWRATNLLLEQWPAVNSAVTVLLLAPDLPLGPNAPGK